MSPDSPEKQGKDEVIDLGDVAEELTDASVADDLDASFDQELEDLFSEDLELQEPEMISEDDSEDMLVLDDVVEDEGDDDLLVLDDLAEDGAGEDLIELDDVVEVSGDEDLLVLDDVVEADDDALVLDDVVEDALVLDDIVEDGDDETVLDLGEVAEEADEISDLSEVEVEEPVLEEPIAEAAVDIEDEEIDFDLGEADILAADDEEEGELDADGLDDLIDDLGGDTTVAEGDADLEELFEGDAEVDDLDKLLDEPQSDDLDELDDLLGSVEDEVELVDIGEDVLADEDIESLLGDEQEEIELSEEGLEPLEEVAEAATAEPELVESDVAEIESELETEVVMQPEDSEVIDVAAEESAIDFVGDLELVEDDDLELEDDDIDLGELLEDAEIDFSDFEEEAAVEEDVEDSEECPADLQDVAINSARIEELIDRLDLLESKMPDVDAIIESHAGEKEGEITVSELEEKAASAAKRPIFYNFSARICPDLLFVKCAFPSLTT